MGSPCGLGAERVDATESSYRDLESRFCRVPRGAENGGAGRNLRQTRTWIRWSYNESGFKMITQNGNYLLSRNLAGTVSKI